jgi:hypothetical protein
MDSTFQNFRAFESEESAGVALGNLLTQAEIPYQVVPVSKDNDLMWGKAEMPMSTWLQIRKADFEKVNYLLEESAYQTVELDNTHFLNSFTEQELMEVMYKADEWSAEDVVMARKILEKRGKKITAESLNGLKQKRLNDLQKPKPAESWLLIIGFGIALLGGFFAIMIGWSFYTSTKTLPNGKNFYVYDKNSRTQGRNMMLFGSGMLLVYILFFLFRSMAN